MVGPEGLDEVSFGLPKVLSQGVTTLTFPTVQKSGTVDENVAPVSHNLTLNVDLDLVLKGQFCLSPVRWCRTLTYSKVFLPHCT